MRSSGMLRRVALVRTDVSEEHSLQTNVHSSPILVTLMIEALGSSETSVLTRVRRHSICLIFHFEPPDSEFEILKPEGRSIGASAAQ
jgi:hypothetical protein